MAKESTLPQFEHIIQVFDTDKGEAELRKELAELLPEARKYIHEVYDIYPQDSPESIEFTRIAREGRNGIGLEPTRGRNPSHYYLINSDEQTAFALGDEVYMTTSFINSSRDEDILASFPAHEIEHVNGQHLWKKISSRKKLNH